MIHFHFSIDNPFEKDYREIETINSIVKSFGKTKNIDFELFKNHMLFGVTIDCRAFVPYSSFYLALTVFTYSIGISIYNNHYHRENENV